MIFVIKVQHPSFIPLPECSSYEGQTTLILADDFLIHLFKFPC